MKRILILATTAMIAAACAVPVTKDYELCLNDGPKCWGDQGDGTYVNPVLNADYSDPDAIRYGDEYLLVASDFHFMGIQLLKSKDMVNWEYVTQVYKRIDMPGYDTMEHYSHGSWAPTIREHDGKLYVFFCTPTEGLFMTCAEKPEGPWSEPLFVHEGNTGRGWEDPCPFWDEDGQAYLGHSILGAGPIFVHKMAADGTRLLDDGVIVYEGPVAEGTKFHKMNGWYYLSIPEGGVGGGYQAVLRSKSIYGPYEKKVVLERGTTDINGPHQGALLESPDGAWWFLHFQHTDVLGRVMHLQPVVWGEDGWPAFGVDLDGNGVGEPVYNWKMPVEGTVPSKPASSDDFSEPELGVQWQWNHNPVDDAWSLTENPGSLTLHAIQAADFLQARNSLTQKMFGYTGEMTVKLNLAGMEDGMRCGLAMMGGDQFLVGVRRDEGVTEIYQQNMVDDEFTVNEAVGLGNENVWLRFTYDIKAEAYEMSWSVDAETFNAIGTGVKPCYGYWKGARPALYCYSENDKGGYAMFDYFNYSYN